MVLRPRDRDGRLNGAQASLVVGALGLCVLGSGGCAGSRDVAGREIVIDSSSSEWSDSQWLAADERSIYLRWTAPTEQSLASVTLPMRIELDVDGSADTGRMTSATSLGVDLVIEYVPRTPGDNQPRGPMIQSFVGSQTRNHAWQDIGFYAGPTHASTAFEARIDRSLLIKAGLPAGEAGTLRGRAVTGESAALASPTAERSETPGSARMPAAIDAVDRLDVAGLPRKPAGAVRLVSYNVLWGSPHKNPAPFARIFAALDPDVVVAQEWQLQSRGEESRTGPRLGEPELQAWFSQHVAIDDGAWTVECTDGLGVALITRHPLVQRGPQNLLAGTTTRWDFPVRLAAGVIETPIGELAIGSVHLKASGTLGSEEDRRREAEAVVVNQAIRELGAARARPLHIIAGDFNMNGTTRVAGALVRGLDADGSDLAMDTPRVLGDNVTYTFVGQPDEGRPTAVRLDYITYPDAALRVVQSFVLDTSRLSDEALRTAGLERTDSWASDHLPVVVDLVPANPRE